MKKLFALLSALALCLSLAACGGEDDDPRDVVGGDWRVTGIVRDSGTITRNGEDTDVLVCVHADSADFYLDDEVQTLYDYVSYPITLQSDPWEAFQSIDFADRDGDGKLSEEERSELVKDPEVQNMMKRMIGGMINNPPPPPPPPPSADSARESR